jgi:hypothetical protein
MKVHEIMKAQDSSDPWSFGLYNGDYAESGVLTTAFARACRTQDQTPKKYITWWAREYPSARPLMDILTLFFSTIIYTPYEPDASCQTLPDVGSYSPFEKLDHVMKNCSHASSVERGDDEPLLSEGAQTPREQARRLSLSKLMFVNYLLGIPSPNDQSKDHGYLPRDEMVSGAAAFTEYCGFTMAQLHDGGDLYDDLGMTSSDVLRAFVELMTVFPQVDPFPVATKQLGKLMNTVMPSHFIDSVNHVMSWPGVEPLPPPPVCGWGGSDFIPNHSKVVDLHKIDEEEHKDSDPEADHSPDTQLVNLETLGLHTSDPEIALPLPTFEAKMFSSLMGKAEPVVSSIRGWSTYVSERSGVGEFFDYDDEGYEELRQRVVQRVVPHWFLNMPRPFLHEQIPDAQDLPPEAQKTRRMRVANWVKGVFSDFRLSFVDHYFPSLDPQLRKACVIAGGTVIAAVFGFSAYKFIEAMIPKPAVEPEIVPTFVPKGDVDKSTHAVSTPWWEIGSSGVNVLGGKGMNKSSTVTNASHGMVTTGTGGCISYLLGSKETNRASRSVRLEMKHGRGIRKVRALALDSKSFVAPAHFFADVFANGETRLDLVCLIFRHDTGNTVSQPFVLSKNDISFGDKDADLVRIAHGMDSLQFSDSAPMYRKKVTDHVNLTGYTCFETANGYDVAAVTGVSNCHPQMMMIGDGRMTVPDHPDQHEMLRGKPMENTVCYPVDGPSKLILGDCGSPIILNCGNDKGNFPALGMFIGTSTFRGKCYETFVMLSDDFKRKTDSDLFERVLSEPIVASTLGSFADMHSAMLEPVTSFKTKMDVVVRYGEPVTDAHSEMIAKAKIDCKLRVALNTKASRKDRNWGAFMPGAKESEFNSGYHLVGKDNDLRTYSGSKDGSGDNVSLPTSDERVVAGIYSELPGIKALRAPVTSPPSQAFNPVLFFLGIAPWQGHRHVKMDELVVGLTGPGIPSDSPGRSLSLNDLGPEVAKTFVNPRIPRWIIRAAGAFQLKQKRQVVKTLRPKIVVSDMAEVLEADVPQMFMGIKRPDDSNIIKGLDRATSWGSIFKPEFGSGTKNDVVCTTESGELGVVPGAEDTWIATIAATFLITMGFLPAFMVMTVFCKDELYPVVHRDPLAFYPVSDDMIDFYSKLYGIEGDDDFFDLELGDDAGYREFFETKAAEICKVKVKTRAVFCLPAPVNLAIRMFFMPLLYLTAEFPIQFDLVSSLDMDGPHYEQSMMDLTVACWDYDEGFPRFFDADVSGWDKIMPYSLSAETLLVMIELVIDEHIQANTYNHQIRVYAWTLLRWWANTAVFYSSLIFLISVMPSGLVITLLLNSFMNQVLMFAVVIDYCEQHSIPLPKCLSEFVLHQAHGDDSRTGVTPLFVAACKKAGVPSFSFFDYQKTMAKYGILATLASKGSEGALAYQRPERLVFLQHSAHLITIPAYSYSDCLDDPARFDKTAFIMAAPLGSASLIKMLGAWETRSPLDDSELLFQEMRAQVYQSIPYGKDHFLRLRKRVMAFTHPVYKPSSTRLEAKYAELFDWNKTLSWYVEKFCRDGQMCPGICNYRRKHKMVHDATFKLLGEQGTHTLSYERV